ncbi:MAG: ribonuclease H-like domain-containing protein [Candidatus Pacebacteria bacterium]|nr:ribonuclease H-like domain-containing protein [Candidatus Paceibacterota bacterium]
MRKVVFDIETRNLFEDVGKNDPALLDISVLALYDSETDTYSSYTQEEFPKMWPIFEKADVLIGFNSDHFDIPLLDKYYPGSLRSIKSIDMMVSIKSALGRRLSLKNVASSTLKVGKSADGLQAYHWWKEGRVQEIRDYCIQDVKVTKELYEHILQNKKIKYKDGPETKVLEIDTTGWEDKGDHSLTYSLGF